MERPASSSPQVALSHFALLLSKGVFNLLYRCNQHLLILNIRLRLSPALNHQPLPPTIKYPPTSKAADPDQTHTLGLTPKLIPTDADAYADTSTTKIMALLNKTNILSDPIIEQFMEILSAQ